MTRGAAGSVKSFAGGDAERDARIAAYASQLGWYARAAAAALGKPARRVVVFWARGEAVHLDEAEGGPSGASGARAH